jgi:excisionase family DNA binding protein
VKSADQKSDPLFYSVDDAAHELAMSKWWVREMLRRGVLRARKAGRRTIIENDSFRAYAAALPAAEFNGRPLIKQVSA